MKKFSTMLIALLAAVTLSANTFTKVNSAPTDWSGQYLVVYEKSATEALVFNGEDAASDYVTATVSGDVITSDDLGGYLVTIAAMEGGYSVQVSNGKYIGGSSEKNTIAFGANPKLNTISMSGSVISIMSETKTLQFNSNKDDMRFRYYKPSGQKQISLYKADTYIPPVVVTYDTISVSDARQRIRENKLVACYIKGVVATAPTDPASYGNTTCWLTDIDNSTDSIYGYQIAGLNGASVSKIEDIPFHLGDTVMLFANKLENFKGKYEINGGYFVEMLGKSSAVNANSIFKYAVCAKQWGPTADEKRYKYEVIFSKIDDQDIDNALHLMINSTKEKGISGSYNIWNNATDSSYVDGEGPVDGSIKLTYVSTDGLYNAYNVAADLTVGGVLYRMDTTVNLAGYDEVLDDFFALTDDAPIVPKDGDTLTCTQALQYAQSLDGNADMTDFYVRGYATGFSKISGRTQQSIYMADDASAKQGTFSAYLCYTQNLDSIVKGDYIVVRNTGKDGFTYYAKGSCAQMSKGDIYRLSGSNTQRPRNPQLEARPEGAITVAEAMVIGNALQAEVGQTVETKDVYTVVGYIVDVNRQMDRDTATWYMHDVQGEYGDFQAYKCKIQSLICENDFVYVTGKIAKYQKSADKASIEIARGKAGFIEIPSDLKQVVSTTIQTGAKKVLFNNKLLIVREGVAYDLQGNVVR